MKKLLRAMAIFMIAFAVIMAVTYGCNMIAPQTGITAFILRCVISAAVPNIMMLTIYGRTEEFRYFYDLAKNRLRK